MVATAARSTPSTIGIAAPAPVRRATRAGPRRRADGDAVSLLRLDYEISSNASPISGRKRQQRLIYLSLWSDYQGQAEVKGILGESVAALDERPLEPTTGRAVAVRVPRGTHREPDGVTYQGSATVGVFTT
ncbi:hypothetical protein [Azorhizophilus paspali]|uniref:Uncharacterized protein n=1 Tax=Azorhizophilus paspali TaxID=69963 RepID=A0ABV6SLP2_AZOPA